MTNIVLENTPFACRLLEPVDVVINGLLSGRNGTYVNLKPYEIISGINTSFIATMTDTHGDIRLVSHDVRGSDSNINIKDVNSSIKFREKLTSAFQKISKGFDKAMNDWHHIAYQLKTKLANDFIIDKASAIKDIVMLTDYGYLEILDENAFLDELETYASTIDDDDSNLVPLFEEISRQVIRELFATEIRLTRNLLFVKWLRRKPIHIIVTQKRKQPRNSNIKQSTYVASTNKDAGKIVAKHLLINDRTTFVIDAESAKKLSTKSYWGRLLTLPEILDITHEPMPRDVADKMNQDMENAWKNQAMANTQLPEYIKAISNDL